jgi:DNA-binding beta-propeller fold protein YncE
MDCQGQPHPRACLARLRKIISEVGDFVELRSLRTNHGWRALARVGRFDFDYVGMHPQPHTPPDGDPFGLIIRPSGGFYVVDAASNTLGSVDTQGRISVIQFVPDPPHHEPIYDAAPTCAARTPDGALVIGTESGTILRWKHHHMTRLLVGGKVQQIVACVADHHGNVYLANLDTSVKNFIGKPFTGSVVKVTPKLTTSYIAKGLNYPTGMTLGPHGDLYVTLDGLCPTKLSLVNSQNSPLHSCPGSGRVVRIDQR